MPDHGASVAAASPPAKHAPSARHASGLAAEEAACAALQRDGMTILGRRLRTKLGEIDIVAADAATLSFVEVKQRQDLATAALALTPRQQARLLDAAALLLAENPDWAREAMRFDVVAVDAAGRIRRIKDAFRLT